MATDMFVNKKGILKLTYTSSDFATDYALALVDYNIGFKTETKTFRCTGTSGIVSVTDSGAYTWSGSATVGYSKTLGMNFTDLKAADFKAALVLDPVDGDLSYTGNIIITSMEASGTVGEFSTMKIDFEGNGDLAEA